MEIKRVNTSPGSLYITTPTKGLSTVFAILFFISGILHIWQNILKYKSLRIGFLFPWAAVLFVVGFALREWGAFHPDGYKGEVLNIFIASQVLLFVAPPVYNGANYFVFGRVLYYLPYLSIIHPGRVWSTFIFLDVIVGVIASNGASYLSNTSNSASQQHTGLILVRASLILLLCLNAAFTVLILHFHWRILGHGKLPTTSTSATTTTRTTRTIKYGGTRNLMTRNLRILLYTLYTSTLLLVLRNSFRTATAFYPYTSSINTSEALLFSLEYLPMLINTYVFNIFPPPKYLPVDDTVYLAVDGQTEVRRPGGKSMAVDTRPFLLTLIDPFDIVGILTGRDRKNRFWERDGIGGPLEQQQQQQQQPQEQEIVGVVQGAGKNLPG